MTNLNNDEIHTVISESFFELLKSVEKARARRQSLALQGMPLEIAKTRAERRKRAKQARYHMRQKLLLTPIAMRRQMAKDGKVRLTPLDEMLNDDQAYALELWSLCEEILQGRAKGMSFEAHGSALYIQSPISDRWIDWIQRHMTHKAALAKRAFDLQLISAFVDIQNGNDFALSPAQYGFKFFPSAKNKRNAFLRGIVGVARRLEERGY